MSYGAEIVPLTELFFKDEIVYGEEEQEILKEEHVHQVLKVLLQEMEQVEPFVSSEIMAAIKASTKSNRGKR